jgi:hypothetical protein
MSHIKDLKKRIRDGLKAAGYNSRKVSVTEEPGGLEYCMNVRIKDDGVDAEKVKEIAEKERKVDRCEVSGEVLAGGNTYVFVHGYEGYLI